MTSDDPRGREDGGSFTGAVLRGPAANNCWKALVIQNVDIGQCWQYCKHTLASRDVHDSGEFLR